MSKFIETQPQNLDEDLFDTIICDGSADSIRELVNKGANLEAQNGLFCTPLQMAVLAQREEDIIELLLDLGADITASSSKMGTVLHIAALHNLIGHAKLLLARGANVDEKSTFGDKSKLPLEFAKSVEMVKLLLENGSENAYIKCSHCDGNIVDHVRAEMNAEAEELELSGETSIDNAGLDS